MAKKIRIITSKVSLYNKLNSLHFVNEVLLDKKDSKYIGKILRNINSKGKILARETIGDKIRLVKVNPVNFSIFLMYL